VSAEKKNDFLASWIYLCTARRSGFTVDHVVLTLLEARQWRGVCMGSRGARFLIVFAGLPLGWPLLFMLDITINSAQWGAYLFADTSRSKTAISLYRDVYRTTRFWSA